MNTVAALSAIGTGLTAEQLTNVTGGVGALSIIHAWPSKYTGV